MHEKSADVWYDDAANLTSSSYSSPTSQGFLLLRVALLMLDVFCAISRILGDSTGAAVAVLSPDSRAIKVPNFWNFILKAGTFRFKLSS